MLAKITSNIDVISGGRLIWGIGAGWYEHEFKGYGYDFPAPADRIRMLREQVDLGLYTPGSTAGQPLSVLKSFTPPPEALRAEPDLYQDRLQATAGSVLTLSPPLTIARDDLDRALSIVETAIHDCTQ